MIKKYRNKPTVVEAIQWNGKNNNEVQAFLSNDEKSGKILNRKMRIQTLEGCIWASEEDYIIKGTHDDYWAVKPHIFKEKYDEVIERDAWVPKANGWKRATCPKCEVHILVDGRCPQCNPVYGDYV